MYLPYCLVWLHSLVFRLWVCTVIVLTTLVSNEHQIGETRFGETTLVSKSKGEQVAVHELFSV